QRTGWMQALREKVFAGWPEAPVPLGLKGFDSRRAAAIHLSALDFESQANVRLRLFLALPSEAIHIQRLIVEAMDEASWKRCVELMRFAACPSLFAATGRWPGSLSTPRCSSRKSRGSN